MSNESGSNDPLIGSTRSAPRLYTPFFVLILFTVMNLLTYYDRGAVSGSLSNIKNDTTIAGVNSTLNEAKAGAIASAFMVGFFVTCPLFAALGGVLTAKAIILIGLLAWCLACVSTGIAQSYVWLLLSRCCVGIGEAAYAGFTVTIIDNIAPKARRTLWIGTYYCMIPVGTALGMIGGGVIASHVHIGSIPGWRVIFETEVMAMLPVVVLIACFPNYYNPIKFDQPATEDSPKHMPILTAMKRLACNLDYVCVVGGYTTYTFALGAIAIFVIQMVEGPPMSLNETDAVIVVGGATAFTGLVGSLCGGLFVDKMGGSIGWKGVAKSCKFMVILICISMPTGLIALFATKLYVFLPFFVISVFTLFSVTAPVNASILSCVEPDLRTYGISFSVFFMHMLGDFPSPLIAGAISDAFGGENSLRNSLSIIYGYLVIAIPLWGVVAVRATKKAKLEMEKELTEADETGHRSSIQEAHHTDSSLTDASLQTLNPTSSK